MTTFTTLFKEEFRNLLKKKYKCNIKTEEVHYSQGKYRIIFDHYIDKQDQIILIEHEFRRSDPITNLVKTIDWICHSQKFSKKKIRLIHIFDESYYGDPNNAYKKNITIFLYKRCIFLPKKLKYFKYIPITIMGSTRSYKRKDEAFAKALAKSAYDQIVKRI